MPKNNGLIDLIRIEPQEILELFFFTDGLIHLSQTSKSPDYKNPLRTHFCGQTAALLFFEPSTRTRFAFETAAARLGLHPLVMQGSSGFSLEKKESIQDTILNIQAMGPSIFIIRCSDQINLQAIAEILRVPVVNAGWGVQGHPTQALLDVYTWYKKLGSDPLKIKGQKLLVVGDVKHSRVVASHLEIAEKLGYEIAFCAPENFLPERQSLKRKNSDRFFSNLQSGLSWCTAVMALRVQYERHSAQFPLENYIQNYQLNKKSIQYLSNEAFIFHPGPVNYGIEIDSDILSDPRNCILEQVKYGTWLRQALIYKILENYNDLESQNDLRLPNQKSNIKGGPTHGRVDRQEGG